MSDLSKVFELQIKAALRKELDDIVEAAVAEARNVVRNKVGEIAVQMAENYSVEMNRSEMVIRVQLEGTEQKAPEEWR